MSAGTVLRAREDCVAKRNDEVQVCRGVHMSTLGVVFATGHLAQK